MTQQLEKIKGKTEEQTRQAQDRRLTFLLGTEQKKGAFADPAIALTQKD